MTKRKPVASGTRAMLVDTEAESDDVHRVLDREIARYEALRAGIQREAERLEAESVSHKQIAEDETNGEQVRVAAYAGAAAYANAARGLRSALLTEPSAGAARTVWASSCVCPCGFNVICAECGAPDNCDFRSAAGRICQACFDVRVDEAVPPDPVPGAPEPNICGTCDNQGSTSCPACHPLSDPAPGAAQNARATKLDAIRQDRIARGGQPDPSREAVARDVVGSSDLAGIDARPWVGAAQGGDGPALGDCYEGDGLEFVGRPAPAPVPADAADGGPIVEALKDTITGLLRQRDDARARAEAAEARLAELEAYRQRTVQELCAERDAAIARADLAALQAAAWAVLDRETLAMDLSVSLVPAPLLAALRRRLGEKGGA